jgi:hypothetical protein
VKRIAALQLASLLLSINAFADPSPPIRHLMGEPVSMLDWGLDHLRTDLNEGTRKRLANLGVTLPSDSGRDAVTVTYDYARDVILIWMFMPIEATFPEPANEMCHKVIDALRHDLGYYQGEKKFPLDLGTYFVPNGFTTNARQDKTLSESLPKLVSIKATIYKGKKPTQCAGMLMDKTVSFEE